MKKNALIVVTLLAIAILAGACRTRELCPAYQAKALVKIEKRG
jgi:hypothetical protein